VDAGSFGAQIVPIVEIAIAAAEPSQRHQIDLLVDGHGMDERNDLLHDRIVLVILQHSDLFVIARIRCVIRIGDHVLDVEFPRLHDDEAKLIFRDG
jgi:hypothetical protein